MILRPFLNPDEQDRCERCGKPLVPGAAYLGEFSRPSRHRQLCGAACAGIEDAHPSTKEPKP